MTPILSSLPVLEEREQGTLAVASFVNASNAVPQLFTRDLAQLRVDIASTHHDTDALALEASSDTERGDQHPWEGDG